MKRRTLISIAIGFGAIFGTLFPAGAADSYPELGNVKWGRDFDQALKTAKKVQKPVLLLFQEVPGCAGCKQFGREVLTNPAIVKAAEEAFVPVAIFNNQGGKDREVLERYNEPAWNYQVARFLDPAGKDLIPRKDKVWTTSGMAGRMAQALQKAGKPIPGYLAVLAQGKPVAAKAAPVPPAPREAAFVMYCFWEGEVRLGRLPGVLETEAGWLGGREVVKLLFDPSVIGAAELVKTAEKLECSQASHFASRADAKDAKAVAKNPVGTGLDGYRTAAEKDQKVYLKRSPYAKVALSTRQATKINAAIRYGDSQVVAAKLLTEKQRAAVAKR